jgi:hypothetical protein
MKWCDRQWSVSRKAGEIFTTDLGRLGDGNDLLRRIVLDEYYIF